MRVQNDFRPINRFEGILMTTHREYRRYRMSEGTEARKNCIRLGVKHGVGDTRIVMERIGVHMKYKRNG